MDTAATKVAHGSVPVFAQCKPVEPINAVITARMSRESRRPANQRGSPHNSQRRLVD
jgi:hypothetical protein